MKEIDTSFDAIFDRKVLQELEEPIKESVIADLRTKHYDWLEDFERLLKRKPSTVVRAELVRTLGVELIEPMKKSLDILVAREKLVNSLPKVVESIRSLVNEHVSIDSFIVKYNCNGDVVTLDSEDRKYYKRELDLPNKEISNHRLEEVFLSVTNKKVEE